MNIETTTNMEMELLEMLELEMLELEMLLEQHKMQKRKTAQRRKNAYKRAKRRVAFAAACGLRPEIVEREMAQLGRSRDHARYGKDRIDWQRSDDCANLRDCRNRQAAKEEFERLRKGCSLRDFLNELIDAAEQSAQETQEAQDKEEAQDKVFEPWKEPWETVEVDGHIAVVHTAAYGSGWSTRYIDDKARWFATSRDVVEAVHDRDPEVALAILQSMGVEDIGLDDVENLKLSWVPKGAMFRVREYDGREWVEILDPNRYWTA